MSGAIIELDEDAPLRLDPGMYFGVPDADYHADCAPEPSLSAGFAMAMLQTSPRRAKFSHPRLSGTPHLRHQFEPTAAMTEGSALHRLILDDGPEIRVIRANDYKTNAAKEAKKAALAAGETPVLEVKLPELQDIAASVRRLLAEDEDNARVLSSDYASEVTFIWQEKNGIYCRIRADRAHRTDGGAPIYDFKFTDRLKSPADWDRAIIDSWWDMRAAFYARGSSMIRDGEEPPYRYIIAEKEPPYESMVLELSDSFMQLGHKKAAAAIDGFANCMASNTWPGYPRRTLSIMEPGWAESRWLDRLAFFNLVVPPASALTGPRLPLLDYIENDQTSPMSAG